MTNEKAPPMQGGARKYFRANTIILANSTDKYQASLRQLIGGEANVG